ncbi:MAG: hypothetical protein JNL92_01430 [Opitutaceae bacterium]|nr:hypothetical protein [Opitutaceae bacterium]
MCSWSKELFGFLLLAGVVGAQPVTPAAGQAANVRRPLVTEHIVSVKAERIAPNRAALTLALKPDVAARLKLYDAVGAEVTVARTPDGGIKAEVDPQRGYVLAPPPPERRSLPRDGLEFPARYVTFAAGAGTVTRTNLGGLFLRPSGVPLTWNEQLKAYATELFVGYEFEDGREIALPVPRTVTFFVEGSNARIVEDRVTIERSGGAGYKRVQLSTGQVEGETLFTARVSPRDELKASVAVRREVGGLKLALASAQLPAFGIGSGVLTVSLLARDGMPLAANEPLTVQLTSGRIHHPATVVIAAGGNSAQVDLRSTGVGTDRIVAQAGTFRDELGVRLVFPVAAAVAALVGGALGGAARYLRNRNRRTALLVRRAMEGMLVGLILVGAAWAGLVGFELSAGVLGTPFGAFVLAALSGYLGCVVLDRVAGKTFGSGKE